MSNFRKFIENLKEGDVVAFAVRSSFFLALQIFNERWEPIYWWNDAYFKERGETVIIGDDVWMQRCLSFADEFIAGMIHNRGLSLSKPQFYRSVPGNPKKNRPQQFFPLALLNKYGGEMRGTRAYRRERERLHHVKFTVVKLDDKGA